MIKGLLEAVEMARERCEPAGMIAGLREIGKMMGYYAPARQEVEVVAINQAERRRLEAMSDEELSRYGKIERDPHGHLRLGEIEFGRMVRDRISRQLDSLDLKTTMIDKDLGYELRCADPIPFDAEYTRDLGYGAVKFLLSPEAAKYGAIVSVVGGQLKPLVFEDMIDPKTLRMRPRIVDVDSVTYEAACKYMTRLEKDDFEDPAKLTALAGAVKMTVAEFKERFERGV